MPDRDLRYAIRFRTDTRRAESGLRRMRHGVRSISEGLRRLESRANTLVLGAASIAGAQRAVDAVVGSYSRIETALVGVAKTADLGGAELARLDERITGLSLTPEIGQTRVALLEIAQAAGQLGVQGVDDLTRFTATIAKLEGASSDLGGAEAATALARILGVAGESIATVDRLGSVIARLGNTFRATEGEITHAGTRVATTLSALYGVSAREAVELGAALRDLGLRAEVGATGLGQAFKRISDTAREGGAAGQVLERTLGQSLEQIRERLAGGDALGVFTDFLAGLRDAGGATSEILAALQLDAIESSQVIGTLFKNVDRVREVLAAANDEWRTNTALTQEALRAAGTFSRQMQLVRNEIDVGAAAIGRDLAPALLAVAQHWEYIAGVALVGVQVALGRVIGLGAKRAQQIAQGVAVERRAARARIANAQEQRRAIADLAVRQRDLAAVRAQDAARELSVVRATTVARTQHGALIERERRSQARLAAATTRAASAAQQHAQAVRTAERATARIDRAQRRYNRALSVTRRLARGAGVALAALGGPLGALLTLLSIGATGWALWGRAARDATAEAEEAVRAAQDRVRSTIESTRPPGDRFAADVQALRAELASLDSKIAAAQRDVRRNLPRAGTGRARRSGREARRDLARLEAEREDIRALLAQVPAAAARLRAAFAGGNGTGGDTPLDGLLGGEPAEALARIRDGILDAEAARRGALNALIREEQKALAEIDALQGQQGVDEKERLDLRIRTQEEFQARRIALIERGRSEEAEAERRAAAAAARERAAAHARAEQAEEQRLERRRQRIEAAAAARADVARQFESGRDTLATPWERATAAIERWAAAARRAVALRHDTAAALAGAGPDAALHRAAAAAEAEEAYTRVAEIGARRRARAGEEEARRRLAASKRWQDGVRRGLAQVREETTNYAQVAERAVTGAFRSMADGIEEFVRTGKLRIGDLVEDVLAQFTRLAVQQAALGLFDWAGGVFGLGAATTYASGAPLTGPHGVGHTGGIAGALATRRAGVPAAAFAGAPRLHRGGLASDEVPAILRRGEGVFTPEQMRALGPPAPPEVHIEIRNEGTPQRQRGQPTATWDGRRWVVGVVLADLEANGPLSQGLQQRFALPPRL